MTNKNDSLGDRMKFYEGMGSGDDRLMPRIPTVARLDGKAFHTFCRGLERPYDLRLTDLMVNTTKHLVKETAAKIGYTQSDEITLIWLNEEPKEMIYFDGRVQKMLSVLSAQASVYFNKHLAEAMPEKADMEPVFDCRVFNVPTKYEAVNCLIWREMDATRNSVTMAAQSVYSHRELHGKHQGNMHDMLMAKDINWNDYPASFKRGTYVQRETYEKSPGVIRSRIASIDMPPFLKVTNKIETVFNGEKPSVEIPDDPNTNA